MYLAVLGVFDYVGAGSIYLDDLSGGFFKLHNARAVRSDLGWSCVWSRYVKQRELFACGLELGHLVSQVNCYPQVAVVVHCKTSGYASYWHDKLLTGIIFRIIDAKRAFV